MAKTVYSLVLSAEVVQAVDALAARQGTSRSALVEQVLADYASVAPPGQRHQQTLAALHDAARARGLGEQARGQSGITLRAALHYRYTPFMQYNVEIYDTGEQLGHLHISLRSRNEVLLGEIESFFRLWNALEQQHLPLGQPGPTEAAEPPRQFARVLRRPEGMPDKELGQAVAGYVANLNTCLNEFLNIGGQAAAAIEQSYLMGLAEGGARLL